MVALVTDIIERKRTEEEKRNLESRIQQSQMMEAIGTLAGGIAHQFNNSLTGITGNIELLEIALAEGRDINKYSDRLKTLISNMTHLTDQLLAYARGGKYQPKFISFNDLVKESLPMIHHRTSPSIRIKTELQDNISNVQADFTQMQMVLSAVVANAVEAITEHGYIRISTKNETVTNDYAYYHPGLNAGKYTSLLIEDNGKGMDEGTKSHLFEPFFTTKFQGRGLGMAAVYGIIKNHAGWISVDSVLGEGTSVRMLLPATAIKLENEKKSKPKIVKGTGTILVVEDETMVMDVSCAMLEALGYNVIKAKTGTEAIDLTSSFGKNIDLVLLDIGLPDMGGEKVFFHIKEASPNTKVIICSGYALEGPAQEIMTAGAQDFIQKPFTLATLSGKLKKTIMQ